MKFDSKKVLTVATCKQAHAGQMGWFGDDLSDLLNAMSKNPVELKEISYAPFFNGRARYMYFYPSEEPVKYRPFDEEELNQLVGKVIVEKSTGKRSVITQAFKMAVSIGFGFNIDAGNLLEYYTFVHFLN